MGGKENCWCGTRQICPMNNQPTGNRLDNFIRSYGTTLPKNVQAYALPAGDKHLFCPFCDRAHNENPLLKHDFVNSDSAQVVPGVFTCDECQIVIERMENRILKGKMADLLERRGVNADPYFDAVAEGVSANALRNINAYAYGKRLPPDAHRRYMHLSFTGTLSASEEVVRCIFCDRHLGDVELDHATIVAPVGLDIYNLDGGELLMCNSCEKDLDAATGGMHEKWEKKNFDEAGCPKCDNPYLITSDEGEFRSINKTHGEHMCPACAYNNLEESNDAMFFVRRQTTDFKYSRYVDAVECACCQKHITVDQTLTPDYILRTHVSEYNQCICRDCKDGEKFPFGGLSLGDTVWSFYFEADNTVYALKRAEHGIHNDRKNFRDMQALHDFFKNLEK